MVVMGCNRGDEPASVAAASPKPLAATAPSRAPGKPRRAKPRARSTASLTYDQRVAELDRRIDGALRLTEKNQSSLGFDRAAQLTLIRAHLTGSFDDYARADTLVGRAFEVGDPDHGPFMTRARLDFALRRIALVEADFERRRQQLGKGEREHAEDALFAAELALLGGRYDEAEASYRESLGFVETQDALGRLARLRWGTGAFDEAEALIGKALAIDSRTGAETIAELHVMLGRMDLERGRYADALGHLHDARAALGGYWLVEQHMAEALALEGHTAQAEAVYLEILANDERPEVLDALAELHRARGEEQDAAALVARATRCHEARLAQFAGAAYGHAIEHFLEHGDDPQRTLALAVEHHAIQPNAEAKALLARARLAAGDPERAEQVLEEALQTPWSTVDFHLTAAEIFGASGNEPRAKEQLLRADAINPRLATVLDGPVPWQGTALD